MTDRGSAPLVPQDFEVPAPPEHNDFRFEPLSAKHNERDYAAWTGSIDHICSTPGFVGRDWPVPMPLDKNLADLVRHAEDFANRTGFTWSLLALDSDEVLGCLYIYPSRSEEFDADVRSWVVVQHADLDVVVWQVVSEWLATSWPFKNPEYAARPSA